MRDRASCVKVKLLHQLYRKKTIYLMSKSITQGMKYRRSLMKYAEKYCASRKFRSHICFWRQRRDGTAALLVCQSRRPRSRPRHAPQKSDAGLARAPAPSAAARLFPAPGEPVLCYAQNGTVSGRKAEKEGGNQNLMSRWPIPASACRRT